MNNEFRLLVTSLPWEEREVHLFAWLAENGQPLQVMVKQDVPSLVGDIYIGRVQNILSNIDAAFVEIQPGMTVYYPMEDEGNIIYTKKNAKKERLCQGDEIVVQIMKDPIKTKQAVCTTNLSFPGQNVILTSGKSGCGVSRKIAKDKRAAIKQHFTDAGKDYGFVFRTGAEHKTMEELETEVRMLEEEYESLLQRAGALTCFTRLRKAADPILDFLDHLPRQEKEALKEILFDDPQDYQKAKVQLPKELPLRLYEDTEYPLWKLYGLSSKLEEACRPKVWMRSGAFLVIEPTEALTVIDVNSGKNIKKTDRATHLFQVNLEACEEIARQLRLRNLSGIILVDFINMEEESQQEELLRYLRQQTAADPIPVQVIDYTKLGLVELTRKKVYPSLLQQLEPRK